MAILNTDIKTYLSGGAGNSNPNASLGGAKSTTLWTGGTLHDLFDVVTATKTPPSTLTISLDSATTAAMRATEGGPLHDWSVWREDEGSRTPYLTGTVTVVDTARP